MMHFTSPAAAIATISFKYKNSVGDIIAVTATVYGNTKNSCVNKMDKDIKIDTLVTDAICRKIISHIHSAMAISHEKSFQNILQIATTNYVSCNKIATTFIKSVILCVCHNGVPCLCSSDSGRRESETEFDFRQVFYPRTSEGPLLTVLPQNPV